MIRRQQLLISSGITIYAIGLVWSYITQISQNFALYVYNDQLTVAFILVSILLTTLPALVLPHNVTQPSDITLWVLFLFVYIPTCVIPPIYLRISVAHFLPFQLSILGAFALLVIISRRPPILLPQIQLKESQFWLGLGFITLLCLGIVINRFGIPTQIPSLNDVYDVRDSYKDDLLDEGYRVSYIIRWLQYTILPFWLFYGLEKRNTSIIALASVAFFLVYTITGSKAALFILLFVLGIRVALRNKGKYFAVNISWGIAALVPLATLIDWQTQSILSTSLLVRRSLITPGWLAGIYYDFFSRNFLALMANNVYYGIPARMLGYTYPYGNRTVPQVIGSYYLGTDASANANLWADGFANFGYPGIFVFTILLGGYLFLFNSLAIKKSFLAYLLLVGPSYSLVNSSILNMIVGNGGLIALFLLWLIPESIFISEQTVRQSPQPKTFVQLKVYSESKQTNPAYRP